MFKALALAALLLMGPPSRVALLVSDRVVTADKAYRPGIHVIVRIPEDPRNRGACLIWESEGEAGHDCWEYNEIPKPATQNKWIKVSHSGHYDIQVVLYATDKQIVSTIVDVEVE